MHHMDVNKTYREKARRELLMNATSFMEQTLEATSHKTAAVRSPTFHIKDHPNKTKKSRGTLLEK